MIKKIDLYQIICDGCGLCGNTTPVSEQYPSLIREEILKSKTERVNPLDVEPGQVTRSELKLLAKDLGWKVGKEDLCPACLDTHLRTIK